MDNKLKLREEINDEDKWALDKMIKDEEEFNTLCKRWEVLLNKLLDMKNHILDNSKTLANFLKIDEEYDRLTSKIYIYANMNCDTNTKDASKQALKLKAENLVEKGHENLSFVIPEILKSTYDNILKLLKEENLLKYQFYFEQLFREKPYILSDREEAIISLATSAFGGASDAFYNLDNADITFDEVIDEDGKRVELTTSNYFRLMKSKNRNVRKNTFEAFYKYYSNHKNTFGATLKSKIKENFFFSKVRGYNNPLEMSLFSDNIDRAVYDNLITSVHQNLPSMYEYMNVRKKLLGLDEIHMYDLYCDLISNKVTNIPFTLGKELIFEALKPLGEDYLNNLSKAFKERWIDIYPNVGKISGAYKWGCFDSYPYVLLNYDNTIDSVSTMAHELGHAMHSYYSNKTQDYTYSSYPIFLAEIASTVNEVLFDDYMYKHAKTKNEKILYLTNFLDKVRTTIYRQTMFAEFELLMHNKEEEGIPLTEEEFSNTYYELNKLYYGPNVISDENIRYEWSRISHFYSSFYVYKYATGLISALSLASDILDGVEGAKDKYLEFLSSGCSDYPLEILKKAGVDITTEEPIKKAFKMFNDKLNELKLIIND